MRIGTEPGPEGQAARPYEYVVYDAQSGAILATHLVVGATAKDRTEEILETARETSGLDRERLAILTNPKVPTGSGALRVDPAKQRLVRSRGAQGVTIRP